MAVKQDYQTRTIDDLCKEALEIIKQRPGLACGGIGDSLFSDHAHINGSAPYARLAGKVMRRLQREGKATQKLRLGYLGWYSTEGCADD